MLAATGNINENYAVIGVVHATVVRPVKEGGCGQASGLPVQEAYEAVTEGLKKAAAASGGDGVIHIGYDYRVSTTSVGCSNTAKPLFEVYGWGTAIKRTVP